MISGCTVASRAFLPQARVLAQSFIACHPGARFYALMADRPQTPLPGGEPFVALSPADVGIEEDELHRRGVMYSTQGLAASMKPALLRTLLSREQGPVVYLDADGMIYASLDHLGHMAQQHSLILSAHTLDPHPLQREQGPEQIIFQAGAINAGMIAVGESARGFLDWWGQRTRRHCVFDRARGLMLAQTWLTMALCLFDSQVLRDRGCNVAGWNLQARDVQWRDQVPWIDDAPLRHFHFAGSFDPRRPDLLTPIEMHARWWPTLQERPGTARLVREYAERLLDSGYLDLHLDPGPYACTPQGVAITPWMRERYRLAMLDAEAGDAPEPPNPFLGHEQGFLDWLQTSARELASSHAHEQSTAEEQALAQALTGSRELTKRISELEQIRDEAIDWAQRVSAELEILRGQLEAERQRPAARLGSMGRSAGRRLRRLPRSARATLRSRSKLD